MTDESSASHGRPAEESSREPSSGYWYPQHRGATSVDVLNLLRRYRTAEADMRARTRSSMNMNETDLIALRYLLKAQREDRIVLQRDLVRTLGVTSASVTALVDRLSKSGHVRRESHPNDRRAVIVVPTIDSDNEVRETLGAMHQRMIALVDGLDENELAAVAKFLGGMVSAVHASQSLDDELREAVREHNSGRGDPRP
ncbi:MarR family winged helix-turn-helix transcriptional regulator [Labedella endophytica]|uniref:MarR family transcriptional regulator n=1 Tax=Labedella endophytica TaxID=1523160 RepID=A0A3S0VID6_9MICO|nr:MarR family transcriptional regulator [Labedella endophytica]RUR03226.1 MarR family transcriptional regulator [Labedella endophytica]